MTTKDHMIDPTPYPIPIFYEPSRGEYGYDNSVHPIVVAPDHEHEPDSIVQILGLRFFNHPEDYWLCRARIGDQTVASRRIDVAAYNIDSPQPWPLDKEALSVLSGGEPPRFVRVPTWPVVSSTNPLVLEVQIQSSPTVLVPLSGVCVVRPFAQSRDL